MPQGSEQILQTIGEEDNFDHIPENNKHYNLLWNLLMFIQGDKFPLENRKKKQLVHKIWQEAKEFLPKPDQFGKILPTIEVAYAFLKAFPRREELMKVAEWASTGPSHEPPIDKQTAVQILSEMLS